MASQECDEELDTPTRLPVPSGVSAPRMRGKSGREVNSVREKAAFNRYLFPLNDREAKQPGVPFSGSGASTEHSDPKQSRLVSARPFYGHYDVYCAWDQDEEQIDTSAYSPNVGYARMHLARLSMDKYDQHEGTSGLHPSNQVSRKGSNFPRPVQSARVKSQSARARPAESLRRHQTEVVGNLSDLFQGDTPSLQYLRARLESSEQVQVYNGEIGDKWKEFASRTVDKVDIVELVQWAIKLRPRSVHDFKPLLILMQGLLKDFLDGRLQTYNAELQDVKALLVEREHAAAQKIAKMSESIDEINSTLSKEKEANVSLKAVASFRNAVTQASAFKEQATTELKYMEDIESVQAELADRKQRMQTQEDRYKTEIEALQDQILALKDLVQERDGACEQAHEKLDKANKELAKVKKHCHRLETQLKQSMSVSGTDSIPLHSPISKDESLQPLSEFSTAPSGRHLVVSSPSSSTDPSRLNPAVALSPSPSSLQLLGKKEKKKRQDTEAAAATAVSDADSKKNDEGSEKTENKDNNHPVQDEVVGSSHLSRESTLRSVSQSKSFSDPAQAKRIKSLEERMKLLTDHIDKLKAEVLAYRKAYGKLDGVTKVDLEAPLPELPVEELEPVSAIQAGDEVDETMSLKQQLRAQEKQIEALKAQVAALRKTKPLAGVLQEEPDMELEGVIARKKTKKKIKESPEAIALKAAEAEIEALQAQNQSLKAQIEALKRGDPELALKLAEKQKELEQAHQAAQVRQKEELSDLGAEYSESEGGLSASFNGTLKVDGMAKQATAFTDSAGGGGLPSSTILGSDAGQLELLVALRQEIQDNQEYIGMLKLELQQAGISAPPPRPPPASRSFRLDALDALQSSSFASQTGKVGDSVGANDAALLAAANAASASAAEAEAVKKVLTETAAALKLAQEEIAARKLENDVLQERSKNLGAQVDALKSGDTAALEELVAAQVALEAKEKQASQVAANAAKQVQDQIQAAEQENQLATAAAAEKTALQELANRLSLENEKNTQQLLLSGQESYKAEIDSLNAEIKTLRAQLEAAKLGIDLAAPSTGAEFSPEQLEEMKRQASSSADPSKQIAALQTYNGALLEMQTALEKRIQAMKEDLDELRKWKSKCSCTASDLLRLVADNAVNDAVAVESQALREALEATDAALQQTESVMDSQARLVELSQEIARNRAKQQVSRESGEVLNLQALTAEEAALTAEQETIEKDLRSERAAMNQKAAMAGDKLKLANAASNAATSARTSQLVRTIEHQNQQIFEVSSKVKQMQSKGGLPDKMEELLAKSEELRGKVQTKAKEIVLHMKNMSEQAPKEVSELEARHAREVNTYLEMQAVAIQEQVRAQELRASMLEKKLALQDSADEDGNSNEASGKELEERIVDAVRKLNIGLERQLSAQEKLEQAMLRLMKARGQAEEATESTRTSAADSALLAEMPIDQKCVLLAQRNAVLKANSESLERRVEALSEQLAAYESALTGDGPSDQILLALRKTNRTLEEEIASQRRQIGALQSQLMGLGVVPQVAVAAIVEHKMVQTYLSPEEVAAAEMADRAFAVAQAQNAEDLEDLTTEMMTKIKERAPGVADLAVFRQVDTDADDSLLGDLDQDDLDGKRRPSVIGDANAADSGSKRIQSAYRGGHVAAADKDAEQDDDVLELEAFAGTSQGLAPDGMDPHDASVLRAAQLEALRTGAAVHKERYIVLPIQVKSGHTGKSFGTVVAKMDDAGTQMDEDTQHSLQQLASAMSQASQAVVQDEEAAAKNLLKHLEAVGEEGGDANNQSSLESILSFTGYGAAPSQQRGSYADTWDSLTSRAVTVESLKMQRSKRYMQKAYKAARVKLQALLNKTKLRSTLQEIKRYSSPPRQVVSITVALLLILDDAHEIERYLGPDLTSLPKELRSLWTIARGKIELSQRNPNYIVSRMRAIRSGGDAENEEDREERVRRYTGAEKIVRSISYGAAKKGSLGAALLWKWILIMVAQGNISS